MLLKKAVKEQEHLEQMKGKNNSFLIIHWETVNTKGRSDISSCIVSCNVLPPPICTEYTTHINLRYGSISIYTFPIMMHLLFNIRV